MPRFISLNTFNMYYRISSKLRDIVPDWDATWLWIRTAFDKKPDLKNLLLDEEFSGMLDQSQGGLRNVLKLAIDKAIPVSALGASLSYFDAYKSETLPLNLVQAQRDYFGAHTYERIDREGIFHTEWSP